MAEPRSDLAMDSIESRRLALDERKFAAELEQRKAELELNLREHERRQLSNPLVLAVIASALGLFGNAGVAILNGFSSRELEQARAETQLELQRAQAEASLVLEAIKTGDTESAAANLEFMVSAGLVPLKPELSEYLQKRKPGQGPVLPPQRSNPEISHAAPDSVGEEIRQQVRLFSSPDRKSASLRLLTIAARGSVEKRAVISACLAALAPLDDHYRTDLYAVLTLGRLDDGWCGIDEERRKLEAIPVASPKTVDDAFRRAHATALERYAGPCVDEEHAEASPGAVAAKGSPTLH
jgi:hypothetical protein